MSATIRAACFVAALLEHVDPWEADRAIRRVCARKGDQLELCGIDAG